MKEKEILRCGEEGEGYSHSIIMRPATCTMDTILKCRSGKRRWGGGGGGGEQEGGRRDLKFFNRNSHRIVGQLNITLKWLLVEDCNNHAWRTQATIMPEEHSNHP